MNFITATDEFIPFRGVAQPPTRYIPVPPVINQLAYKVVPPPVINGLKKAQNTIEYYRYITNKNHSYWTYVHQLS